MTGLLVALGAGLGAALRYAAGWWLDRPWEDGGWPLGTLLVNVAGSALLGGCAGLALTGAAWAVTATGVCGGLTTYSSFAVQAHAGGARRGTAYAVVTLVAGLAACALGFAATA